MADDRTLDVGEFECITCGAFSGPHAKDGMGECPDCAELVAVPAWQRGRN